MIYNLAIIGGGPAGYSAALEAIRYGLTVILFEKDLIGGTCLNRGCVPTKSLIHAATIYADFKKADRYGIHADQVKCDYSEVIKRNQQIIKQLRDGLETQMKDNGIRLMYGEARLIKRNQISCNGETFEAENVLISTGSSAGNLFHDISISTESIYFAHGIQTFGLELHKILRSMGSESKQNARRKNWLKKMQM